MSSCFREWTTLLLLGTDIWLQLFFFFSDACIWVIQLSLDTQQFSSNFIQKPIIETYTQNLTSRGYLLLISVFALASLIFSSPFYEQKKNKVNSMRLIGLWFAAISWVRWSPLKNLRQWLPTTGGHPPPPHPQCPQCKIRSSFSFLSHFSNS